MAKPAPMSREKKYARRILRDRLEARNRGTPRGQRLKEKDRMVSAMGGYLTGGQAKIAAKAEPRNKIDAKDFAVLRAEKAKGRGQGLQDEKMKPGKVMKADKGGMGEASKYKKYLKGLERVTSKTRFDKAVAKRKALEASKKIGSRAMDAAKATRIGKIAAGVAGAALLAKAGLEKLYEKRTGKRPPTKFPKKKMGGGMMMRPRPMGYDKGDLVKPTDRKKDLKPKQKKRKKDPRDPIGPGNFGRDMKPPRPGGISGKGMEPPRPGGGIPNVPGRLRGQPIIPTPKLAVPQMSKGSSVTVKVKLGRNKPTKLF
tara:strand:+ start:975 stop:1913 length:939 start_codon:yes stop_codon:yes gene_type:complete